MNFESILKPACTLWGAHAGSKKRTLEQLAGLLAQASGTINADELFEALVNRERMGSTGFGNGIAIPHCRLASCEAPIAALMHLAEAIDFDARDKAPVDLVFALVVPEEATGEHLEILQAVAGRLDNADYRERLRQAGSDQTLYEQALTEV